MSCFDFECCRFSQSVMFNLDDCFEKVDRQFLLSRKQNQKKLGFKNWMTWKGTSWRHENQKMEENIKCVNTVVPKFFESLSGSQKTLHSLFFRHTSRCSLFKIVLSFSELKNGYSFSCHWNVSNKKLFLFEVWIFYRVPTGTEKPGKWEGMFQSGESQGILSILKSGNHDFNTTVVVTKGKKSHLNMSVHLIKSLAVCSPLIRIMCWWQGKKTGL